MSRFTYKWLKPRKGFAIITLEINKSEESCSILEYYDGKGWTGQGKVDEIPAQGFENFKVGLKRGLEYAFSLVEGNWNVVIYKVEGIFFTDTNPTVVGYVALRAFLDKTNHNLEEENLEELEAFVNLSWNAKNISLIPDFKKLSFKHPGA